MEITPEILLRLDEVIQSSGLSRRQFALSLGNTPSTITEIFSNRIKKLSGSFLKILELQYGINLTWLETGMGKQHLSRITLTLPDEIKIITHFRKLKPGFQELFILLSETFYLQQEQAESESPPPLSAYKESTAEDSSKNAM